jgi:CubicO group peptidase (beta-lactamase class C family)
MQLFGPFLSFCYLIKPCSMKKTSLIPALFLLLFAVSCREEAIEIDSVEDFEAFLEAEMDDQNIPAAAVLIFRGEEVLYEQYAGFANLEEGVTLQPDHLFLVASISKVVTATALLQLYDEGVFQLDDPVNDYLPFDVNVPGYAQPITFRMLLTHTSAIADNDSVMDEQYYYGEDPPISLSFFIENYLSQGGQFYDAEENFYDFEPGTDYEYSNIGSALIGVLVEEISGLDFNAYCKAEIFSPLALSHTSWRLDEIAGRIVTPYDEVRGQNESIDHYTNADYPNGGLRTTARDLHKIAAAIAGDGQFAGVSLLKPATAQAMMASQIAHIDDEVGLHLFELYEPDALWGHDGGEQGVATIMGFNRAAKTGVILLTNQGEADLEDLLVGAYQLGVKL